MVSSGLLDIFPALTNLSPEARLQDLRDNLQCVIPPFFAREIARALVKLGMEASRFQIKQVFLFLLGQAAGYSVEKELGNVEAQLKSCFPEVVDEFERAAYELSVANGKSQRLSYYQRSYAAEMQKICPPIGLLPSAKFRRRWRKLTSIDLDKFFCPSFELWWTRREEADLSDWEGVYMLDNNYFGFKERVREISRGQPITACVGCTDE